MTEEEEQSAVVSHQSSVDSHQAATGQAPVGESAEGPFTVGSKTDDWRPATDRPDLRQPTSNIRVAQVKEELVAWVKTLMSAAVYAVLIVTFLFQVARVEGQSMAPTLEDQDRLIVNKLHYRLDAPIVGDIVMLYYPRDPDKSFVKRVVGEPGDTIRVDDGRVFRNDVPMKDDFVADEYKSHDNFGP